MQVSIAAQADDRRAFDQLRSWSEEKNNPFAARAEAAWIAVFKSHNVAMFEAGFTIPWKVGVDPSKLTLADLKKSYATAPSTLKPALIEYIATKRTDLPLHDRDQFLIDVILDDSSLSAVEYEGRYLDQLNKLNKAPLAIDYYLQWWNDNKQRVQ